MNFLKNIIPNRVPQILLVVIVLLGGFLRIYGLGDQSLWTDELGSWHFSNFGTISEVIKYTAKNDTYPPGYYMFLSLIIKHIGDTEWILRFPSALAGILSIIAIFFLGKRLYTVTEGLISAALMAVLYIPIYVSQDARAYSFLLLFLMLSTYFYLPILAILKKNKVPNKSDIFWYVFFSTVSCYLHYFGLYLVSLQGLALFILFIKI